MRLWRDLPRSRLDVTLSEARRRGRTVWIAWWPRPLLRLGLRARVGRLLGVFAPQHGVRVLKIEAAATGSKDYPVDPSATAIFMVPIEHARSLAYTDGEIPRRPDSKSRHQVRCEAMRRLLEPDPEPVVAWPLPRKPTLREIAKAAVATRRYLRIRRSAAATIGA